MTAKGRIEIVRLTDAERLHGDAQSLRSLLDFAVPQRHSHIVCIPKDGDTDGFRHRLPEEVQSLCAELDGLIGHPGDVASGSRENFDQADTIGITHERQDDRDGGARLLGRRGRGASGGHDDVDLEPDKLGRESRQSLLFGIGPPGEVNDILLLDIPEIAQSVSQRDRWRAVRRAPATGQESDPPCPGRQLRPRGHRGREQ